MLLPDVVKMKFLELQALSFQGRAAERLRAARSSVAGSDSRASSSRRRARRATRPRGERETPALRR